MFVSLVFVVCFLLVLFSCVLIYFRVVSLFSGFFSAGGGGGWLFGLGMFGLFAEPGPQDGFHGLRRVHRRGRRVGFVWEAVYKPGSCTIPS